MDIFDFHARHESGVPKEIEDLAFLVIGAAIEVHRQLGPGLAELHYKKAMSRELTLQAIAHQLEVRVDVVYKCITVGETRIDLLVSDVLIVELKAVDALLPVHKAQTKTYLKLKGLPLALLINFNVAILRDGIKRVINT